MGCSVGTKRMAPNNELLIKNSSEIIVQPGNFVRENENRFQEVYRLGELIKEGGSGEVRVCFNRDTGYKCAVKVFRKSTMTNEASRANLEKEIRVLKALDHPNIIRIYEFFEDIEKIYIVIEYCAGGELASELVRRGQFSEVHAARVMSQLFSAVAYLHSNSVVHRDIRPENILLEDNTEYLNIKLISFETAATIKNAKVRGRAGTVHYMAPEVLAASYSEKCDVWSCGVVMYVLLAGHAPFTGDSEEEILENAKRGKAELQNSHWDKVSEGARSLIQNLLMTEQLRPSAAETLHNPWVAHKNNQSLYSEKLLASVLSNLQSFQTQNKLCEAVGTFIISQCIPLKDTRLVREVFRSLDRDGDGKLTREDLLEEYKESFGAAEAAETVECIMCKLDSNHTGFINYSEFIRAALDRQKVFCAENIRAAFAKFDRDNSGSISSAELKTVLSGDTPISHHVWSQIIQEIDQNGDGEIDLQEFQDLLLAAV